MHVVAKMNYNNEGSKQGEILHLNNGHPMHTDIEIDFEPIFNLYEN